MYKWLVCKHTLHISNQEATWGFTVEPLQIQNVGRDVSLVETTKLK